MAYTALDPADIVAGQPTKEEIFTQIRTNQEDFDSRIDLLGESGKFDIIDVNFTGDVGSYSLAQINERCPVYKAPSDGSIISVIVTLLEASTSGTIELDIEVSTDNGVNWNSVLATTPQVTTSTVGSISSSFSFVSGGEVLTQNDLYRIQLVQKQVDQGDFHVSVYGDLV